MAQYIYALQCVNLNGKIPHATVAIPLHCSNYAYCSDRYCSSQVKTAHQGGNRDYYHLLLKFLELEFASLAKRGHSSLFFLSWWGGAKNDGIDGAELFFFFLAKQSQTDSSLSIFNVTFNQLVKQQVYLCISDIEIAGVCFDHTRLQTDRKEGESKVNSGLKLQAECSGQRCEAQQLQNSPFR